MFWQSSFYFMEILVFLPKLSNSTPPNQEPEKKTFDSTTKIAFPKIMSSFQNYNNLNCSSRKRLPLSVRRTVLDFKNEKTIA